MDKNSWKLSRIRYNVIKIVPAIWSHHESNSVMSKGRSLAFTANINLY